MTPRAGTRVIGKPMKRRQVLQALVAGGAVVLGAGLPLRGVAAATPAVRITLPAPGSAGSAWQPLIDQLKLNTDPALVLD